MLRARPALCTSSMACGKRKKRDETEPGEKRGQNKHSSPYCWELKGVRSERKEGAIVTDSLVLADILRHLEWDFNGEWKR